MHDSIQQPEVEVLSRPLTHEPVVIFEVLQRAHNDVNSNGEEATEVVRRCIGTLGELAATAK